MAKFVIILVAVISYLIGSVNFSIMISKTISGKDIRESGSGNAGATNMLRTHGKKVAIITLLLDVLKGVIAVLLVSFVIFLHPHGSRMYYDMLYYIAGVCVILGHNFPLYFGFKGGKGVATSLGVILVLNLKTGSIVGIVSIAVIALTRYVSLGSITGGALYIVLELSRIIQVKWMNTAPVDEKIFFFVEVVCIVIMGGLLIARHHANIKRLLNGTENKLGAKKE